jgi:hypothetical protein
MRSPGALADHAHNPAIHSVSHLLTDKVDNLLSMHILKGSKGHFCAIMSQSKLLTVRHGQ